MLNNVDVYYSCVVFTSFGNSDGSQSQSWSRERKEKNNRKQKEKSVSVTSVKAVKPSLVSVVILCDHPQSSAHFTHKGSVQLASRSG